MKKIHTYAFLGLLIGFSVFSCKKDDDNPVVEVELRDEAEVAAEDEEEIRSFLETHFYEMIDNPLNSNYQIIQFDTIAGSNNDKEPIMGSPFLKTKTVTQNDIEYTLFYLQIREGDSPKPKPTFADLVVSTYRGQLLNGIKFDESVSPIKFNLPGEDGTGGLITGFTEGLQEFRGATNYIENPDNTISFTDDFGIGAVFVPSGLAYFASPPLASAIPEYAPLIFTFQVYAVIQGDADEDGIPSIMEDLNGDKLLYNDNSDSDNVPDFADVDDDNDGTLTKDEIIVDDANGDGFITEDEITFPDSNNNGIYDYLDPDVN